MNVKYNVMSIKLKCVLILFRHSLFLTYKIKNQSVFNTIILQNETRKKIKVIDKLCTVCVLSIHVYQNLFIQSNLLLNKNIE